MATFSPRELAGVLVALGHLGYNPGPAWLTQVCVCVCVYGVCVWCVCVVGGGLWCWQEREGLVVCVCVRVC